MFVNETTPVPPSATARAVPNVNAPDISKLPFKSTASLITTVPPAESIVKLPVPDVVVIVLLFVIPKSKLPAYTPPN